MQGGGDPSFLYSTLLRDMEAVVKTRADFAKRKWDKVAEGADIPFDEGSPDPYTRPVIAALEARLREATQQTTFSSFALKSLEATSQTLQRTLETCEARLREKDARIEELLEENKRQRADLADLAQMRNRTQTLELHLIEATRKRDAAHKENADALARVAAAHGARIADIRERSFSELNELATSLYTALDAELTAEAQDQVNQIVERMRLVISCHLI